MIVYLPLCEVYFPQNVMVLYSILLPLASLDIIPPELSTDVFFTMTKEEEPPSIRLEALGFETRNTIYNLGSMFYFVVGLQFFVFVIYLLKRFRYCCKNKCCSKFRRKFSIKDLMNNLFMLYFEASLEVYLSMYLNMDNQTELKTKSDKFSYGLGYVLLLPSVIVVPCIVLHVISKPYEELKDPITIKKWGLVYKDLKLRSKSALAL